MTRLYTATERKEASRQALALLTASLSGGPTARLTIESKGDPLVLATVVAYADSLLRGYDGLIAGASEAWLHSMAESIEAMPEGGR